jgi:hypothetical protein
MRAADGGMSTGNSVATDAEKGPGAFGTGPQQTADAAVKPDYAVGYRKPPIKSQFQKGKSGNPRGRAKTPAISDMAPLIESILAESVKVREGEQTRIVSNLEAVLQAQLALALKGNPAAIRKLFELAIKAGLFAKIPRKSFIEFYGPEGENGKILRSYHAETARQVPEAGAADEVSSLASGDGQQ